MKLEKIGNGMECIQLSKANLDSIRGGESHRYYSRTICMYEPSLRRDCTIIEQTTLNDCNDIISRCRHYIC